MMARTSDVSASSASAHRRSTSTSDDDVTAELERLRAENAQLKRTANREMALKVSEKGGVSASATSR